MFLLIPVGWALGRRASGLETGLYAGTIAAVLLGAVAWGWRLPDLNTFYLFFAPIAVLATPVAAIAVVRVVEQVTARTTLPVAVAIIVGACVAQLAWGAFGIGLPALARSAPLPEREPIPASVLEAIRALPPNARLAYECRPFEEATFAQPQLMAIDTLTGRRVVPLCFQADVTSHLIGGIRSPDTANGSFAVAPQRALFPTSSATPTPTEVRAFLAEHGIDYLYVDAFHPNQVVPGANLIAGEGTVRLFSVGRD
jgi:hypothetical protein